MAQADEFASAISVALDEAAKRHQQPELNAVLGALAVETGKKLALIEAGKMRKHLFQKICSEIKREMNRPANGPGAVVKITAGK